MQYYDTGKFGVIFTVLMVLFILLNVRRARGSQGGLFIRRIAGLNAIDEAIGRATEMGKPVLMVPGIGDYDQMGVQAQALSIFSYVAKVAAKFSSPIRLCVANAATYALAQEMIRAAYQSEGLLDRFDPDSVQFLTDRQFAFAAGVSGMIHRERAAATFFLGSFYAESLIFAETANTVGAIQVAGSTQNTQTPFFIAACDYVLIGDEFYAASAYLSREPVLVGTLIGQDWSKMLVAFTVLGFTMLTSVQMQREIDQTRTSDGKWIAAMVPHKTKRDETYAHFFFTPATWPKGEEQEATFTNSTELLLLRKAELSAGDATIIGEAEVLGEKGTWYRWEIDDNGKKRFVDDFVVVHDDGRAHWRRSYRSRPQREETPLATGGAE